VVFAARAFSQSLCWRLQPDATNTIAQTIPGMILFMAIVMLF
jgi:hypothetical protein